MSRLATYLRKLQGITTARLARCAGVSVGAPSAPANIASAPPREGKIATTIWSSAARSSLHRQDPAAAGGVHKEQPCHHASEPAKLPRALLRFDARRYGGLLPAHVLNRERGGRAVGRLGRSPRQKRKKSDRDATDRADTIRFCARWRRSRAWPARPTPAKPPTSRVYGAKSNPPGLRADLRGAIGPENRGAPAWRCPLF